jgi:hypothetical protein
MTLKIRIYKQFFQKLLNFLFLGSFSFLIYQKLIHKNNEKINKHHLKLSTVQSTMRY